MSGHSSCPSRHFDITQLRGRDFNMSITAYTTMYSRCHLLARQSKSTYFSTLPVMFLRIRCTSIAYQTTRPLDNRTHLGRARKAAAAVLEQSTCHVPKIMT
ncbi:hypothetical protein TNCV_4756271 [Trichonephila clavipes]|nr:hypothetical protein TNCV_4756271 [Trichonephila clavipes]